MKKKFTVYMHVMYLILIHIYITLFFEVTQRFSRSSITQWCATRHERDKKYVYPAEYRNEFATDSLRRACWVFIDISVYFLHHSASLLEASSTEVDVRPGLLRRSLIIKIVITPACTADGKVYCDNPTVWLIINHGISVFEQHEQTLFLCKNDPIR